VTSLTKLFLSRLVMKQGLVTKDLLFRNTVIVSAKSKRFESVDCFGTTRILQKSCIFSTHYRAFELSIRIRDSKRQTKPFFSARADVEMSDSMNAKPEVRGNGKKVWPQVCQCQTHCTVIPGPPSRTVEDTALSHVVVDPTQDPSL
jgi:hypothetical protein